MHSIISSVFFLSFCCASFFLFFFNDPPTTEIYTLSLHDALPISAAQEQRHALPPVHVARHAVALEQVGELVGDTLGPAAAKGLIRQRDGELLAVRIGDHAGELLGLRTLVGGLPRARLAQEPLGQLGGAVGEALSRHAPSVRAARDRRSRVRRPGESRPAGLARGAG